MLKAHFAELEKSLIATSQIPANSGHSLHKGTPREAFIRTYLEAHLPSTMAIGSGEIIDKNSKPGDARRQFDIVIYKRNYPKLDFGGGVSAFLAESVIATIEVKSTLDKAGVRQAISAAISAKALVKSEVESFTAGFIPPAILNYIVAYEGPRDVEAIMRWVLDLEAELGIPAKELLKDDHRIHSASTSLDGIFVLGLGHVSYDNFPFGFINEQLRQENPRARWAGVTLTHGSLLILFQQITQASMNVSGVFLNPLAYMDSLRADGPVLYA